MNTEVPIIKQRNATDCSICCTAMALRLSYESVLEVAGDALGWDGLKFDRVFDHFGFDIIAQPRLFMPSRPAIFSVPSRLVQGHHHAVYYERGQIVDPTTKTTPYQISSALHLMTFVYQWEPLE